MYHIPFCRTARPVETRHWRRGRHRAIRCLLNRSSASPSIFGVLTGTGIPCWSRASSFSVRIRDTPPFRQPRRFTKYMCMPNCSTCGQPANHQLKNGTDCCMPFRTQCSAVRQSNAKGVKRAHATGLLRTDQLVKGHGWNRGKTHATDSRVRKVRTIPNSQAFSNTANGFDNGGLKRRIIEDNLMPYVCNNCNSLPIWLGKPLMLQLEHKNGVRTDNRLENLCFLCPNCHTQTTTWGSRNKKRATPSDDEIRVAFTKCEGNLRQTCLELGYAITRSAYTKIRAVVIQHFEGETGVGNPPAD